MRNPKSEMGRILLVLTLLFFIPSVLALTPENTCLNASYLQKVMKWSESGTEYNTTQDEVYCPYGCLNNQCKPSSVLMPFELYLFLAGVTILFLIISFVKGEIIFFPWITMLLCFIMIFLSFNMNKIFYEGGSYSVFEFQSIPLVVIWLGLALIMLTYAIVSSFAGSFQKGYKTRE